MLFTKNSVDGALLDSCRIKWTSGDRVGKLPGFLRPLAVLGRNVFRAAAWMANEPKISEADSALVRELVISLNFILQSNVEGDVAVFGAGSGKAATTMAHSLSKLSSKKLYIFDSFQGFPAVDSEIDAQSPFVKNNLWTAGTGLKINQEDITDACTKFLPANRLQVFPGWFGDTLPQIAPGTKFCAVYLDCKMYKSTSDVLNYLFSNQLLSTGAMLFFENWDSGELGSAFGETKAFEELLQKFNVAFSDRGSLGWGGKRILIHSYAPVSTLEARCRQFFTNLSDWEDDARRHFAMGIDYVFEAGVKGDIIEFGTCTGRSAAWIAKPATKFDRDYQRAADERFKPKRLFLFDSFEGLPESESQVDQESPHVKSGVWGAGTMKVLSQKELKELCEVFMPSERIIIGKGWFKDTIHTIPRETRFSLVHVDGDLYQSTIDVLDGLFSYGMLSEGAVLYFDDWNPNHASPRYGERKAWTEMVAKYSVEYSDWGFYGWGCARFIVHSYNQTPNEPKPKFVQQFANATQSHIEQTAIVS